MMQESSLTKDILVVDDTPENLNLLLEVLSKAGYCVRPVKDAESAYKTIEKALPDLILLDVMLPGINGFKVCERLKSDEKTKNIPIIFLSSLDSVEEKVHAFESGGVDYITKPFRNIEVIERVKNQLELSDARKKLLTINVELEEIVAERTKELKDLNKSLEQEILERKKAEEVIKRALAENQVLLDEIYHRTRNNMQLIISFLMLKGASTNNEESKKILSEIENKVYVMSMVQEKIYNYQNLTQINLKSYIKEVTDYLIISNNIHPNQISVVLEVEDIHTLIEFAMPIGLILTELLSNSFKHAFSENEKGEIRIFLNRSEGNKIILDFSDNGIGISKDFDVKKDGKLGLKTVCALVQDQLKGALQISNSNGTCFHMEFKDKV